VIPQRGAGPKPRKQFSATPSWAPVPKLDRRWAQTTIRHRAPLANAHATDPRGLAGVQRLDGAGLQVIVYPAQQRDDLAQVIWR
jgi:hypothetical protein